MELDLHDFSTGKPVGKFSLSGGVFSLEPSRACIKRVVDWQLAKARSGTHKSKNLSEVSGTGKKPHAQKGSGRARQGTLRSVHMRGGATVHGPRVRSHAFDLPKKIRKLALRSAIAVKLQEGSLVLVDDFSMNFISSKECLQLLRALTGARKILSCSQDEDRNFLLSARNLAGFKFVPQVGLNVLDILNNEVLLMSRSAVEALERRLSA
jgi:large subunit ribosomal protein L4